MLVACGPRANSSSNQSSSSTPVTSVASTPASSTTSSPTTSNPPSPSSPDSSSPSSSSPEPSSSTAPEIVRTVDENAFVHALFVQGINAHVVFTEEGLNVSNPRIEADFSGTKAFIGSPRNAFYYDEDGISYAFKYDSSTDQGTFSYGFSDGGFASILSNGTCGSAVLTYLMNRSSDDFWSEEDYLAFGKSIYQQCTYDVSDHLYHQTGAVYRDGEQLVVLSERTFAFEDGVLKQTHSVETINGAVVGSLTADFSAPNTSKLDRIYSALASKAPAKITVRFLSEEGNVISSHTTLSGNSIGSDYLSSRLYKDDSTAGKGYKLNWTSSVSGVTTSSKFTQSVDFTATFVEDDLSNLGISYSGNSLIIEPSPKLTALTVPATANGNAITTVTPYGGTGSLHKITIGPGVTLINYFGNFDDIYWVVDSANTVYSSINGVLYDKNQKTLLACSYDADVSSLPSTLEEIQSNALYHHTSTGTLTLPSSVKTIGAGAFSESAWSEIVLPSGLVSLGAGAFSGSQITSLAVPSQFTLIPDELCENCSYLTSVTFSDSVTEIGDDAFGRCSKLTAIRFPSALRSIGSGAFRMSGLLEASLPSSLREIGESAFYQAPSLLSVTLPSSLTALPDNCFADDISLQSCPLPDSIRLIGESCFRDDGFLSGVTLSDDCTTIGSKAFTGCGNLTDAFIGSNSLNFLVENGVVYDRSKSSVVTITSSLSGAYTLPKSVLTLKTGYEFASAKNLTSWSAPSSLTGTLDYTFDNSTALVSCDLSASAVTQFTGTFRRCYSLTKVTLPTSLQSISGEAFAECVHLESLIIPSGVTGAYPDIFEGCQALKAIYLGATTLPAGYQSGWNQTDDKDASTAVSYYLYSATEPSANPSQYWHYDTDGKTPIIWG